MLRGIPLILVLMIVFLAAGCSSDSTGPSEDSDTTNGGGGRGGSTSGELIDDALSRGEIDEETALVYKVFAMYNDSRLPSKYNGNDSQVRDSGIKRQVVDKLGQLSPSTRDILYPYLIQPFYKGSWFDLRRNGGGNRSSGGGLCLPWEEPCAIDPDWKWVDGAGGKVRVWYHQDFAATDLPLAQLVASEAEGTIWPSLTTLMGGRLPVSDAPLQNNGGTGALDIALVTDASAYGGTSPVFPQPNACDDQAVYLEVNHRIQRDTLLATVAHEFMHALQWTYPSACNNDFEWMDEAVATWVEHYVYPYDTEHLYADFFLRVPHVSLNLSTANHPYGAYLFFFYIHEGFNASWIPKIYDAAATSPGNSLQAIENGLTAAGSTNFEERWPEFARRNWNQGSMDQYTRWDGLTDTAKKAREIMEPKLVGSPDDTLRMPVELPHLSAQYYHVKFSSPSVHTVHFVNGLQYKVVESTTPEGLAYFEPVVVPDADTKGASVQILYRVAGQDWEWMDITDKAAMTFCRDQSAGRVEEMVVIFANSDFEDRNRILKPQGMQPFLWFSNAGCWKWQGQVTVVEDSGCEVNTIVTNAEWGATFPGIGAWDPGVGYAELVTSFVFQPMSGGHQWQVSGGCGGCTVTGNDWFTVTWPNVNVLFVYNFVPTGAYKRGFDLFGFSPGMGTYVNQHWTCVDPPSSYDETVPLFPSVTAPAPDHGLKLSADGSRITGTIDQGDGVVTTISLTAQKE